MVSSTENHAQPHGSPRFTAIRAVKQLVRKPQFRFAFVVLVPLIAWYAWFSLGPIVRAFWMATVKYKLLNPALSEFIGLNNFTALFAYEKFWIAVRHTIEYAVFFYLGMLPLSLFISACLSSVNRARNLYQGIIFLPVVVSMVAISLLFKMLMNPEMGQFNRILHVFSLPTYRFLGGSESALISVVGVDLWKSLGFYVIITTAGMLGIPSEMYDAAEVDGAGPWQRFWRITLPLLGHTLALVSVLMLINGLQVYTQVEVLTGGGPGTATYVLNLLVYDEAFSNLRFGFATAAAFSLFIIVIAITLIQLKLLQPKWKY
jgi:multiple sugar transport system permease protein